MNIKKILTRTSIFLLIVISGAAFLVGLSSYFVISHQDSVFTGQAECGVIFGAAVWRDNIPSSALKQRIDAGAELFQNGHVTCLILSGGPSKIGTHETDVMKEQLIKKGIQEQFLYTDYNGHRTHKTIENLPTDKESLVMISNDFHLARIKLIASRHGLKNVSLHSANTKDTRLNKHTYYQQREIGGWILYLPYFPKSPLKLPWI